MADKLTAKQKAFVQGMLVHGNATQAARDAGYSTPNVTSAKLVKTPVVASALAKGRAMGRDRSAEPVEQRTIMTRGRALELLKGIAEGEIGETELSLSGDAVPSAAKLKDRIAAIKQLAKMEGWEAAQQHEHSGSLTLVPATEEAAAEALRREAAKSPALQARLKLLVGGG